MKFLKALLSILIMVLFTNCASKKYKDISFLNSNKLQPSLNIFVPKNKKFSNNNVLIFVHGGNWNSGDKKMYNFFGRNFSKKGITTVIVGYTLSPIVNYDTMTREIAEAITWTKKNISNYKGNSDKIFLTGHSAGGHLIALAATNKTYLKDQSIVKGVILNDAAGLDMKNYLEILPPTQENNYLQTWSNNSDNWKDASPIYFLDKNSPPFMMYVGTKTYESIKVSNERFLKKLHEFQPNVQPIFLDKKHVPMMTQYIFPNNKRYKEIIKFMNSIN